MRIRPICLLLLIPGFFLMACSPGDQETSRVVADINGFKLCQAEYLEQLAAELEFDGDFKVTPAAQKALLEQVIRRELLIQEAQRQKLDRQKKFVRAIERYWKATLIRDLLEMKGEQIGKTVIVSEADARSRYKKMQGAGEEPLPFSEMRGRIKAQLREEKKALLLTSWIEALRKNATVAIDETLLTKER